MAAFVAAFLLIAIATSSAAQERHGTIAVVRYELKRLIVAADSRNNLRRRIGTSRNDTACKIAALGKYTVFVASGLTGYDNAGQRDRIATWYAIDEARRVYERILREHGEWRDEYLDELAKSWGEAAQSRIAEIVRFRPAAVQDAAVNRLLTTALVATGRGMTIQALLMHIAVENGSVRLVPPHHISPEACPPCALGKGEIVAEFTRAATERAKFEAERFSRDTSGLADDEREVRRIIRLVDLTIELLPDTGDVGGPIDALELRAGEPLRWVQRKSECPE